MKPEYPEKTDLPEVTDKQKQETKRGGGERRNNLSQLLILEFRLSTIKHENIYTM
jgi:hypothetical protein